MCFPPLLSSLSGQSSLHWSTAGNMEAPYPAGPEPGGTKIQDKSSSHLSAHSKVPQENTKELDWTRFCVQHLCSSLLIQLHSHQCWRPFFAHCGVLALPEEVAALLLPSPRRLQLLWVLPLPNWWHNLDNHNKGSENSSYRFILFLQNKKYWFCHLKIYLQQNKV